MPIPGLSKFEHFALEIYKAKISNNLNENDIDIMNISIEQAIIFLEKLEEKIKTITNDKNDEMVIYNY